MANNGKKKMILGKKPKSQVNKELSRSPRPNLKLGKSPHSLVETYRKKLNPEILRNPDRVLRKVSEEEYDDLFNRVLTALNKPKSAFFDLNRSMMDKRAKYVINETRRNLLGANRFIVHNSLLEDAVKLSFAKPSILLKALERGIPPFQNMWIEWNEVVRLSYIRPYLLKWAKESGKDLDIDAWDKDIIGQKRVGYHIYRSNTWRDGQSVFTYDQYSHYQLEKDQIAYPTLSLSLNNAIDHKPINQATHELVKNFLGSPYQDKQSNPTEEYARNQLINRMRVESHELWALPVEGGLNTKLMSDAQKKGVNYSDIANRSDFTEMAYRQVIKSAGDIRTIIAILSLLNYDHNITERKQNTVRKVVRMAWGTRVPRNELRVLNIELPKPRGTTEYEKMFTGHGSPKRQHTRMGHWRTSKTQIDGWEEYFVGGIIKWRRWIPEMTCGNPELGIIEKEHHLKGRMA